MDTVLFAGIQASGKSTFFKEPFVVEITNLQMEDRKGSVAQARAAGFRVLGYRLHVDLEEAIAPNAGRAVRKPIPEKALRAAGNLWQPPAWAEGFDALFDVRSADGDFSVREVACA